MIYILYIIKLYSIINRYDIFEFIFFLLKLNESQIQTKFFKRKMRYLIIKYTKTYIAD